MEGPILGRNNEFNNLLQESIRKNFGDNHSFNNNSNKITKKNPKNQRSNKDYVAPSDNDINPTDLMKRKTVLNSDTSNGLGETPCKQDSDNDHVREAETETRKESDKFYKSVLNREDSGFYSSEEDNNTRHHLNNTSDHQDSDCKSGPTSSANKLTESSLDRQNSDPD